MVSLRISARRTPIKPKDPKRDQCWALQRGRCPPESISSHKQVASCLVSAGQMLRLPSFCTLQKDPKAITRMRISNTGATQTKVYVADRLYSVFICDFEATALTILEEIRES